MPLHPQAAHALDLWAQEPAVSTLTPAGLARRRAVAAEEARRSSREPVADWHELEANGVHCRLYRPVIATELPCLVFLHGGGFVLGDLDTHDDTARRLANRTGWAVLSVGYRRAPEEPFPAAVDDCLAVLDWVAAQGPARGLDPGRVAALGDSAGGNLALVGALRRPGALRALGLVYPFLDPACASPSYARTDGGLDRVDALWFWQQYAPVTEPVSGDDPDLAPLSSAALGSLPPTLVQVAEQDTLYDEDRLLVQRAREAGAVVDEIVYPGMVHGFWRWPQLFDAAEEAMADLARWLVSTVPPPTR